VVNILYILAVSSAIYCVLWVRDRHKFDRVLMDTARFLW